MFSSLVRRVLILKIRIQLQLYTFQSYDFVPDLPAIAHLNCDSNIRGKKKMDAMPRRSKLFHFITKVMLEEMDTGLLFVMAELLILSSDQRKNMDN